MQTAIESVYWQLNHTILPALDKDIEVDVAIIGGGMAGLSAAHAFAQEKLTVALLEKHYCGSGASGRSSGFITPDSELDLSAFVDKFGEDCGKKIWDFGIGGVRAIKHNIEEYTIECDYKVEPTLVVTNSKKAVKQFKQEHDTRLKLGYHSTLYNKETLKSVIRASQYEGGIAYNNTFGINPFLYCQGMKNYLSKDIAIYEETSALAVGNNLVETPHAKVKARHIIVCVDRFLPELKKLVADVYHAQTFVLLSERMSNEEVKEIFPKQNFLSWDTELIYNYFRITGDNRLMIGGGSVLSTYDKQMHHNNQRVVKKLTNYVRKNFPQFKYNFEYYWPGLIGISKDIAPIAGFDEVDKSLYYITAAAGLPWAAALGYYAAQRIVHNNREFDSYFSPQRKYPLPNFMRYIIGKRATFALSNFMTIGSL